MDCVLRQRNLSPFCGSRVGRGVGRGLGDSYGGEGSRDDYSGEIIPLRTTGLVSAA